MHAPLPTAIHVEVSRACNVRCCCCGYHPPLNGPLMSWETFERVLPVVSYKASVALFGRGEPLLHPRFEDIVRAVAEHGGAPIIHTNGTLLAPALAGRLYRAGMKDVIFSIFSADPDLHESLQVGVDSDEVWEHLRACADVGMRTRVATCLLRQNVEVLGDVVKRAVESEVSEVQWLRMIGPPHMDPFTPEVRERTWQLVHGATELAKSLGLVVYEYIGDT
jgi:MoaA/NifB/PqqE/SkfB family radical SAM enzyme